MESPRAGEIMVKLAACGVCHSDLSVTNGTIPLPPPLVLGHEGAGVVVEVGEGVKDFAVGDHVVSSFTYSCGQCRFCLVGRPVLCLERDKVNVTMVDGSFRNADRDGKPLGAMCGCGVMSEYATLSVHSAVKIDPSIPLDKAALVGCAVTTGVGAALNTAKVEPGSSVAVFGAGGVGLNVIQGCAVAGAARIIAVDMSESKLELARAFGATDVILTKAGEDLSPLLTGTVTGPGNPTTVGWSTFTEMPPGHDCYAHAGPFLGDPSDCDPDWGPPTLDYPARTN